MKLKKPHKIKIFENIKYFLTIHHNLSKYLQEDKYEQDVNK